MAVAFCFTFSRDKMQNLRMFKNGCCVLFQKSTPISSSDLLILRAILPLIVRILEYELLRKFAISDIEKPSSPSTYTNFSKSVSSPINGKLPKASLNLALDVISGKELRLALPALSIILFRFSNVSPDIFLTLPASEKTLSMNWGKIPEVCMNSWERSQFLSDSFFCLLLCSFILAERFSNLERLIVK